MSPSSEKIKEQKQKQYKSNIEAHLQRKKERRKAMKKWVFICIPINIGGAFLVAFILKSIQLEVTFVVENSAWQVAFLLFVGISWLELMGGAIIRGLYFVGKGGVVSAENTFSFLRLNRLKDVINKQLIVNLVIIHLVPFGIGIMEGSEHIIGSFLYLYTLEGFMVGVYTIVKLIKFEGLSKKTVVRINNRSPEIVEIPIFVKKIGYFFLISIAYGICLLIALIVLLSNNTFMYALGFWPLLVSLASIIWNIHHDYTKYYIENEGYKILPFAVIYRPLLARVVILVVLISLALLLSALFSEVALIGVAITILIVKIILEVGELAREQEWASDNLKLHMQEKYTQEKDAES